MSTENNDTKRKYGYTPKIIVAGRQEKDNNLNFTIPVYQRLFAWRREEVLKLLLDLKEHFWNHKDKPDPYYLGMMTVVAKDKCEYDLIDGQQRFTVMMLMAIVLRKYYSVWHEFLEKYSDIPRLKFTARSADDDYIKALIKTKYTPETEDRIYIKELIEKKTDNGYFNSDMRSAIACIGEFCCKKYESHEGDSIDQGKRLTLADREQFAKNVFENLTFFLAELPVSYVNNPASLNHYFEVMNSAGKGLEQHEILLVNLLKQAKEQDENQDQRELTRIWNRVSQMDETIIEWDDKNNKECNATDDSSNEADRPIREIEERKKSTSNQTQERSEKGILAFPEFLLLVLDLTPDKEDIKPKENISFYQKDKLLSIFEKYKITDIKAFFERMWDVRQILDKYVIRRHFDGWNLKKYEIFYRTPEDETDENDDTCRKNVATARLRQYQSMLYVSTDFYRWLPDFVKFLMDPEREKTEVKEEEMLKELKRIDRGLHEFPGVERAADGSYKSPAEKWRYDRNIERYWFWRLDYCLWDRQMDETLKDEEKPFNKEYTKTVAQYVFRENRSIEHLHPQNQEHNSEWDEIVVNSFGNLAMISSSFNSTQSNDHVQVKFARIQEQIDRHALESLKLLKMYEESGRKSDGWSPDIVKKHEEEMIKLLEEVLENESKSEE